MVSNSELKALIERVRAMGAEVNVMYDTELVTREGRWVIDRVQIRGLGGCGPHPMSALSAAEKIRSLIRDYKPGQRFEFKEGDPVWCGGKPGRVASSTGGAYIKVKISEELGLSGVTPVFPNCYPRS